MFYFLSTLEVTLSLSVRPYFMSIFFPNIKDFDSRDAARIFHTLMHQRLGFKDYYVQGGDWGSQIVEFMSLFYPE